MSLSTIESLASIAGGVVVVGGVVLGVRKPVRKLINLADDWAGEPARPGVPGRAGVMERLRNLDEGQLAIIERLSKVEAQVHPNHGSSMADAVNRIERKVNSDPGSPSVTVTYSPKEQP